MAAHVGRIFIFLAVIAAILLAAVALLLYPGHPGPGDGRQPGNEAGLINDTGITTGENAVGMVSADSAGSKAMAYWTFNHMSYPEASFSVTNVTGQNSDWLVEISRYDKIYAANGTPQYTYRGVAGRVLVSKKTGQAREAR